jgi:L-alanine-DL-glutamate epimerase-like enolase superfamily enzyme
VTGGSTDVPTLDPPLGPGALADALSRLPVLIDSARVEVSAVHVEGFSDGPRPTSVVTLAGGGAIGAGECVAWTMEEQERFAHLGPSLVTPGQTTIGELHDAIRSAERYHRAAVESAALDLALRQASTNLFALARRPPLPVAFCLSIGVEDVARAGEPATAVFQALARHPLARIKIDVDPAGWSEWEWGELAGTGRVVVADFKRRGAASQVNRAYEALPDAWLEDPPLDALGSDASWLGRVALDGYVQTAADLAPPPVTPGAVNIKAARMGGPLEALRALELCAREGWWAYVGGMFEVGPGRPQAQVIASLFTADAWNDVAPLVPGPGVETSRLEVRGDTAGFAPDPASAPAG